MKINKILELESTLNPTQRTFMNGIEWMIFSGFGAGRTYLLAVIYIKRAIITGDWVRYENHNHDVVDANYSLEREIENLCEKLELNFKINSVHHKLKVSI